MDNSKWFDDLRVLGKLPFNQAGEKLRELGETDFGRIVHEGSDQPASMSLDDMWPFNDKPWQHTAHAFGFLEPSNSNHKNSVRIKDAGNIDADISLRNSRVKITLDRLRVANYPGSGNHRILFDFYAQNQIGNQVEHLHFNAVYRVRDGEEAALRGYPIFVGLSVGKDGIAFKCFTVNVSNEDDDKFLDILESDVFRSGLVLATTIQPALAPLSSLAMNLTRIIALRNRNVPVEDFNIGLDFSNILTRARLREGSYAVVQIPQSLVRIWDWNDWCYIPSYGQLVSRRDQTKLIPYNYMIFGISRFHIKKGEGSRDR